MAMKKEKMFCKYCGSSLDSYPTRYFDEYTGQNEKERHCTNQECEGHCGIVIKHKWGESCLYWEECQRCGYVFCKY